MGLKTKPPVGTKVRFTGIFLKTTGQQTGEEGSKRFTVLTCETCALNGDTCSVDLVAVDEPHQAALDKAGYEDIPELIRRKMKRHIGIANLEIVGAKPKAEDYP